MFDYVYICYKIVIKKPSQLVCLCFICFANEATVEVILFLLYGLKNPYFKKTRPFYSSRKLLTGKFIQGIGSKTLKNRGNGFILCIPLFKKNN